MKKIFLQIAVLLFHISVSGQQPVIQDFYKIFTAGMERRAGIFEVMPARTNGCIEFVGGSIMEDCEWSELFRNPNIINRGIDGNTSLDVLNRMNELIRHKPSKVFLETGARDLAKGISNDAIIRNVRQITHGFLGEHPGTKLFLFSVLPADTSHSYVIPGEQIPNHESIVTLNKQLKRFCKKYKITYIDLYPHFLAEDKITLNTSLGSGNSKLSVAGYDLIKRLTMKYLSE